MGVARTIASLCAAVFAVFAALQWNDPDWVVWTALYGATAIVALLFAAGRPTWLACVPLIAAAAWFAKLRFAVVEGWYQTEEGREAVGLLMVVALSGWLLIWRVRARRGP